MKLGEEGGRGGGGGGYCSNRQNTVPGITRWKTGATLVKTADQPLEIVVFSVACKRGRIFGGRFFLSHAVFSVSVEQFFVLDQHIYSIFTNGFLNLYFCNALGPVLLIIKQCNLRKQKNWP